MEKSTLVAVGKVTGAHGVAGNIKAWIFDGSTDTFHEGQSIQLRTENESGTWYHIQKMTPYKKGVLFVLEEITNRDQAESIVGKDIFIRSEDLPELETDTYYWQDLMGLDVIDRHRGNIGKIHRIFSTGAHDILVVKTENSETMVPMVESIVLSVNIKDRTIDVDMPEGL